MLAAAAAAKQALGPELEVPPHVRRCESVRVWCEEVCVAAPSACPALLCDAAACVGNDFPQPRVLKKIRSPKRRLFCNQQMCEKP